MIEKLRRVCRAGRVCCKFRQASAHVLGAVGPSHARPHLGGVYYLFLRGMAPAHPPGTGIFHDQPPAALVEDLSELLHGAARWS